MAARQLKFGDAPSVTFKRLEYRSCLGIFAIAAVCFGYVLWSANSATKEVSLLAIGWLWLKAFLYAWTGITVLLCVAAWPSAMRWSGRSFFRHSRDMWRLWRYSPHRLRRVRGLATIGFLVVLILCTVGYWNECFSSVAPLITFALAIAFVQLAAESLPVGVLLLTASHAESWNMQFWLSAVFAPHRVVCLLQPGRANLESLTQVRRWNCYRTGDNDEWRRIVRRLAKIGSFVVLDTRFDSAAVRYEVDSLFDDDLLYKTFFLVHPEALNPDESGTWPILKRVRERARLTGKSGFVCDDDGAMYELFQYIRKVGVGLPSPDVPLSCFHECWRDFPRSRPRRAERAPNGGSDSANVPTPQQVQQVVAEIRATAFRGLESRKARLRFFCPPSWRTYRLGKEGWALRPKGLGVPVGLSVWATAKDPEFADSSYEGMVKNVEDIVMRPGGTLHRGSIKPCKVAGMDGIEYFLTDLNEEETLGFFWCYENADYEFRVDASSMEHLDAIRPAVDEFMRHFRMG